MTAPQDGLRVPPGVVCWTTHGAVRSETVQSLNEARAYCERNGAGFSWVPVPGSLVDKARNDAVEQLLPTPAQFLLYIDSDMTFAPWAVMALVASAYGDKPIDVPTGPNGSVPIYPTPWADVIGAWCPLRNAPYLPTIDTGTGTWEPHEPNQGPLEVIRTGGAFVLVKRHVFERMEKPWFGVRPVPRAIDIIQEFDGYNRQKFDGRNPFAGMKEWEQITACGRQDAGGPRDPRSPFQNVGEDSNFADKARALGFRIVVQTNVECGHVDQTIRTSADHRAEMNKMRQRARLYAGVLE